MTDGLDWEQSAAEVARQLVGWVVDAGDVGFRIVEVEAYGDGSDSASHARFGPTNRTWPIFGGGGTLYVYRCYGIHWMVNVVVGPERVPGAVLLRGIEVEWGHEVVAERRGRELQRGVLAGPGKVAQALAATERWSGQSWSQVGWSWVRRRTVRHWLVGARVGIDYADPEDRERRWRFADGGSDQVSVRRGLNELKP
jgi:DNA-3-methyladenine glycosylase